MSAIRHLAANAGVQAVMIVVAKIVGDTGLRVGQVGKTGQGAGQAPGPAGGARCREARQGGYSLSAGLIGGRNCDAHRDQSRQCEALPAGVSTSSILPQSLLCPWIGLDKVLQRG